MNNPDHKDIFIPIKSIIDREKDEALAFFRENDFESRLKIRIENNRKSDSSWFFLRRKPALVLISAVLVCCLAAVILLQILAPSPHEKSVRIIEEFLLKNTNLQAVLTEGFAPEAGLESKRSSLEEELECWQNPECRKKCFSQIINMFKEI